MMSIALVSRCVFFFVSLQIVVAQVKRGPSWMYDHVYAASEKPVLARAIESNRAGKSALRTLLDYYEEMDAKIGAIVEVEDYDPLLDSNVVDVLQFYG